MAYDMAAIEYRGLNAVTNFGLSRYIKWLRPGGADSVTAAAAQNPHPMLGGLAQELPPVDIDGVAFQHDQHRVQGAEAHFPPPPPRTSSLGHNPTSSALSLLLQSPKFKEMIARTMAAESSTTSSSPSPPLTQELQAQVAKDGEGDSPQCSFPNDIQTFFGCEDAAGVGYADLDGLFFGDLAAYASAAAFHFELDL
jgi:AP2-like factor, ANT lineage